MKPYLLALGLAALPVAATAQSQIERLEATSEATSENMFALMVNEITAGGADPAPIRAAIPDMTWDDEMRAAGVCMLEHYTDILGEAGVDEMLDAMDALSAEVAELVETGGMASDMADAADMMPEGLSTEQSIQITQDCGMIDIQMRRMSASGFNAAMMEAMQ